jgi:cell division protein ZipA
MESSELRFLILALGILFIAAIYLWERHKSAHALRNRRKRLQKKIESRHVRDDRHHSDEKGDDSDELAAWHEELTYSAQVDQQQGDATQSLTGELEEVEEIEIDPPSRKKEILSLSVASRRKFFTGDAIVSALYAADLSPGPMDIYYRYNGVEELFAVVSMVNPGTFPQDMSRFRSPGLSLFARLPGSLDGEDIFEAMYETAQLLAEKLDGALLGVDHKPLTEETLDEMRALASTMPALRRSVKVSEE